RPIAIAPAETSARPATTMSVFESTAPESPAASAKGTVSPSDMPITTSRTVSPAVKWRSMWRVWGIGRASSSERPRESHAPGAPINAPPFARGSGGRAPPGHEEEPPEREEHALRASGIARRDTLVQLREEALALPLRERRQDRSQRRTLDPLDDLGGA